MKTQKKFYLIYQITNTINGKFYIGKHETNQLDDEYMGSGKYLNRAKEKYGLENFVMTILCYLHNKEEMNLLERMVVTPEFCAREDTYNINVGGDGGWNYVNSKNNQYFKRMPNNLRRLFSYMGVKANKAKIEKMTEAEYEIYCQQVSSHLYEYMKLHPDCNKGKNNPMYGRKHTKRTRQKMSLMKQGEKNNRAGSNWYYDPLTFESHSFLPNEKIPDGWVKGRKMKRK